ncbi:precorrin methylase [Phaeobacter gallaeciensis]|uniref:Precorrin methylase n=1 Tax=Phaeobacter gallaeciensis TaxID=60890 RepID=A0A1B0ZPN3_9RHOB|nr:MULTISPECIES: cobalamin biosynthesis protein [Phaeobacter]MEE2817888.1 cobalamin biosynthesis protein [Pseudomonadota bacterium]ANP36136.1 precorrin methylase [Phaeobacter gallaeciensis]MDE4062164.1 cobalamin biosynthesis protein [Phaeobacter gallaeciensis]MDE4125684.1 cobalamin biosynthesis protein [Phaeobacter gallaeciensis]MDE4129657.1 cobalamin biosynthesis protein [Phaeobacter gallaeciensis]
MKVAGLGFRKAATVADLRAALALTGHQPDALVSLAAKVESPAFQALAAELNLPVIALPEEAIAGLETPTMSPRIKTRFATGSLAEAAALCGACHGRTTATARLLVPRVVTADGLATAAIAERLTS